MLRVGTIILFVVFATPGFAQNPPEFRWNAPAGVAFVVTGDGLTLVRAGGRDVAKGSWRAFDASYMLKPGAKPEKTDPGDRSIETLGPDRVRVRQTGKDLAATFEYTFSGEDVRIRARVENLRADRTLAAVGFEGLSFLFDKDPDGWMFSRDLNWLQGNSAEFRGYHPTFENRIGGSYAEDGRFGVGFTPRERELCYTAFFWWPDPASKAARRVQYVVPRTIGPNGAEVFEMQMRVSENRDWKHLLEPYKDWFGSVVGPVRYKADFRPLVQACLADKESVTADNPLGFHGESRRLDTAEGTEKFCDMVIAGLRAGAGQGCIIWALDGYNPRGAMYRPDFDVLPEAVEKDLPALSHHFKASNLRLGLCARAGEVAIRADRDRDTTIRINADDPEHRAMMWARFKRMIDKGFSIFYLDSFGWSMNDIKLMKFYRERMGPDIQTYVEHPVDVTLAYSGTYCELVWDDRAKGYVIFWGLDRFWEISQWLVPGAHACAISRVIEGKLPAGYERPFHFLMRHHITPMGEDWRSVAQSAEMKALVDEFLDADGKWKE